MKTRAAVLRSAQGPFQIEELALEEPRPNELVVRMVAVGMCHTDLLPRELPPEAFGGPNVYGHEGAGIVEAVGADVRSIAPGDAVVLSINSCGTCPTCAASRPPYCYGMPLYNMSGGRPDGTSAFTDAAGERVGSHFFGQSSFAEYSVVAERSVVRVDPGLDLAKLGPLGCGIQTGAGAILNSLEVEEGASVVVGGAGALGMSAIMATRLVGAGTVIAIDLHASRLELAQKYGATHTISGEPDVLAEQIREITGGGADYAFDTTGKAAVVRAMYEGLNVVGTLGMAGVSAGEMTFDYITMISGRTVRGILEGDSFPQEFIPHLAKLNDRGEFPFDDLITTFPIERINEAEAASASGEVIKPVLTFD